MAGAHRSSTRRRKAPRRRLTWTRYSDERLLDVRICDLGLRLEGTWLERCVREVHADLERRDIPLRPHAWLSHDWFSPDGVPGIAIPFYLAHPRLTRLERSQMLEVEGGSREDCIRILRHECGHAVQHAWQLQRRRRWQQLFGSASRRYPDVYRPNPASRRFVQHLRLYYAQSHPAEDFAETFAVWMQPRSIWRKRYKGWPALNKLEYVDTLMRDLAAVRPAVRTRARIEPLSTIRTTLREYYAQKREQYSAGRPDIYDRELRRLFSDAPADRTRELASTFLRRNRTEIRRLVSRWTGEYQFTLDQVLEDMIGRCRELRLRAAAPEGQLRVEFAMLLAVKTIHYLYSRRNWIAL
ncbi:MAG: putative zinc-binding metallopeptidase [Vicinamibacterales bacterium]